MTTIFKVIDDETGKVVHTMETSYTGSQLDRCRDGFYRKVDFTRFRVEESESDGAKSKAVPA